MEDKIKNLIGKYYGEILTELDEIGINVDNISLSIEINGENLNCKMG